MEEVEETLDTEPDRGRFLLPLSFTIMLLLFVFAVLLLLLLAVVLTVAVAPLLLLFISFAFRAAVVVVVATVVVVVLPTMALDEDELVVVAVPVNNFGGVGRALLLGVVAIATAVFTVLDTPAVVVVELLLTLGSILMNLLRESQPLDSSRGLLAERISLGAGGGVAGMLNEVELTKTEGTFNEVRFFMERNPLFSGADGADDKVLLVWGVLTAETEVNVEEGEGEAEGVSAL